MTNDDQWRCDGKTFFHKIASWLHDPRARKSSKGSTRILLTFRRRTFRQSIFFFFDSLRATIFLNQRRGSLNFTWTIRSTTGRIAIVPQNPDHHHLETDFLFSLVRPDRKILFASAAAVSLSSQPAIASRAQKNKLFFSLGAHDVNSTPVNLPQTLAWLWSGTIMQIA